MLTRRTRGDRSRKKENDDETRRTGDYTHRRADGATTIRTTERADSTEVPTERADRTTITIESADSATTIRTTESADSATRS